MSGVPVARLQQTALWPVIVMAPALLFAVLNPVAFVSVILGVGLALVGLRYSVQVAGASLVLIPVIDQAFSDNEFTELFGSLRITPGVALKAILAFVIICYLLRNRVNPLRYRLVRPLVIWLAYCGCTCLFFHDRSLAVSLWLRLLYWVLYFVFFFVVAARRPSVDGHVSISRIAFLWRAGAVALVIFAGSVLLAKMMGIGGEYYGVGESYGFYQDPWNMAMTLPGLLVLVLLYPWVFGDRSIWTKFSCIILALVTVLASFLTFTRTSLIACLSACVLFGLTLRRTISSRETRLILVLTLVFASAAALLVWRSMAGSRAGNQVASRWSEVDKGDIGSGRLQVFYAAWSKFANASPVRKLLGHGIGAGPEAAEEYTGIYVYLHDDMLEMLVCAGLVGIVLYCWSFARIYREILHGLTTRNIWAVAALVSVCVYNLTSISYMRIYSVTPNTYFALVAGTSLGMLHSMTHEESIS